MSSLLSFLSSAEVEEVKGPVRAGVGGARKPWNPPATLLAIRVWKDGSVFPSQALVDRFNLEYVPVTITRGEERPYSAAEVEKFEADENAREDQWVADQAALPEDKRKPFKRKVLKARYKPSKYEAKDGVFGNGFDVIDSRLWANYKAGGNILFVAPASKDLAKVDLFGSTKYSGSEEEGQKIYDATPVSSVMNQGSNTFGEEVLLPAIKEIYGIELGEDKEYVDMLVVDELNTGDDTVNFNKKFSHTVSHFPKLVLRGEDKGKPDYERRENAVIWGFLPADMLNIKADEVVDSTENTTV